MSRGMVLRLWPAAVKISSSLDTVLTDSSTETAPTGIDPDANLLLQAGKGNDQAFNQLMDKHQKTVISLIYRFTGCNREQALDIAQDVFLRIYQAAERYEAKARFFTFLYTVTLNLCRNRRARLQDTRTVSLEAEKEDAPALQIADPSGSAADILARTELSEVVRACILELPDEQRELVILQRFQGLAYEEICEITGQSLPAVKSKLHRAKLALRKKLQPYLEEANHGVL